MICLVSLDNLYCILKITAKLSFWFPAISCAGSTEFMYVQIDLMRSWFQQLIDAVIVGFTVGWALAINNSQRCEAGSHTSSSEEARL